MSKKLEEVDLDQLTSAAGGFSRGNGRGCNCSSQGINGGSNDALMMMMLALTQNGGGSRRR